MSRGIRRFTSRCAGDDEVKFPVIRAEGEHAGGGREEQTGGRKTPCAKRRGP